MTEQSKLTELIKWMEEWRPINGYDYEVSNFGRVKSLARVVLRSDMTHRMFPEKILKQAIDSRGYPIVNLCRSGKRKTKIVHRLVMTAFHGESDLQIDHIDGNKKNNILSNLRYCTQRENLTFNNVKRKRKSRFVGVCWSKKDKKWKSQIRINGQAKHLGYFNNEYEAAEAYKKALKVIP